MKDDVLLRRFEARELTEAEWHHREHVRLAYLYLLQHGLAEATDRMRSGLKALNAAQNVPENLDRGYHETITCGWMRLMHCALCEFGPAESSDAFLDRQTHLLARRALLFFYSRDRIMSWDAKKTFLEPDLAPLPKSAKALASGGNSPP
jgi:hypothetical protein